MDPHRVFDAAGAVMMISALLLAFLPPYEAFGKWPRFQSYYELSLIFISRFGHANIRSVVYPTISNGKNGGTNEPK